MYAGTLDEVRGNVTRYGKVDVCSFHPGFFSESMADFDTTCVLAFIDVDLRSSIEDCVRAIWPRLADGGTIFIARGGALRDGRLLLRPGMVARRARCRRPRPGRRRHGHRPRRRRTACGAAGWHAPSRTRASPSSPRLPADRGASPVTPDRRRFVRCGRWDAAAPAVLDLVGVGVHRRSAASRPAARRLRALGSDGQLKRGWAPRPIAMASGARRPLRNASMPAHRREHRGPPHDRARRGSGPATLPRGVREPTADRRQTDGRRCGGRLARQRRRRKRRRPRGYSIASRAARLPPFRRHGEAAPPARLSSSGTSRSSSSQVSPRKWRYCSARRRSAMRPAGSSTSS